MPDLKLTELSEVTTPDLADLTYIVDDPGGTPISYKVALSTMLGLLSPSIAQGRLTLVTGTPVYAPHVALTPSATDTAADTVDFSSDHGWVSGTKIYPGNTVGGLTRGTLYWINATDSNTISFHTNLADSLTGASKVNLTANITQLLYAIGVEGTTLYYTPYTGNRICLYNGSTWQAHSFNELSIALSGLTSARPYDVFIYDNSGTLTLELLAWTSDTARATDIVRQDGVYVKSGSTTRRYVGTIYTTGTTSTEDSVELRYVYNGIKAAQVRTRLHRSTISTANTTYTVVDTWRQLGADATRRVAVVNGLKDGLIDLFVSMGASHTSAAGLISTTIGEDTTTINAGSVNYETFNAVGVASEAILHIGGMVKSPEIGRHAYNHLEWLSTAGTLTSLQSSVFGIYGTWEC